MAGVDELVFHLDFRLSGSVGGYRGAGDDIAFVLPRGFGEKGIRILALQTTNLRAFPLTKQKNYIIYALSQGSKLPFCTP